MSSPTSSPVVIESSGFAQFASFVNFPLGAIYNNGGVAAFTTAYMDSLSTISGQTSEIDNGSIFDKMGSGIFVTNCDNPKKMTFWVQGSPVSSNGVTTYPQAYTYNNTTSTNSYGTGYYISSYGCSARIVGSDAGNGSNIGNIYPSNYAIQACNSFSYSGRAYFSSS